MMIEVEEAPALFGEGRAHCGELRAAGALWGCVQLSWATGPPRWATEIWGPQLPGHGQRLAKPGEPRQVSGGEQLGAIPGPPWGSQARPCHLGVSPESPLRKTQLRLFATGWEAVVCRAIN